MHGTLQKFEKSENSGKSASIEKESHGCAWWCGYEIVVRICEFENMELREVNVIFGRESKTYFAGETLEGHVHLNIVEKDVKVKGR